MSARKVTPPLANSSESIAGHIFGLRKPSCLLLLQSNSKRFCQSSNLKTLSECAFWHLCFTERSWIFPADILECQGGKTGSLLIGDLQCGVTDLRNHRKQQVKKCGSNNHRICHQSLHQFRLPPLHIYRVNHIFLLKRLVLVL